MGDVDLIAHHRLALAAIPFYVAIHQGLTWLWHRRAMHAWMAACALTATVFVLGRYIQHTTTDPLIALWGTRLQLATGLLIVPTALGVAHSTQLHPQRRTAMWITLGYGVLFAVLTLTTDWVHTRSGTYLHEGPLDAHFRPGHGWMHPIAMVGTLLSSLALIHLVWRARFELEGVRATWATGIIAVMTAVGLNDALAYAEVVWSVPLFDYGIAIAAVVVGQLLVYRQHLLQLETTTLLRSEESLRHLLEAAPDAIVVQREDEVVFANPAAARLLGYPSARVLRGLPIPRLRRMSRPPQTERFGEPTHPGRQAVPQPAYYRRADGSSVLTEVVTVDVRFDGQAAKATIIRDISERRALEQRLRVADQLASLGTLAAGVAHEINNPLTFIKGNLERLVEALGDDATRELSPAHMAKLARRAREGTERIERVVQDMTLFTREESGVDIGPVDVIPVIESALKVAAPHLPDGAQVVRDYRGRPTVEANAGRLGQVLVNLLINAGQALDESTHAESDELRLTTELADGRAVIAVEDNGPGIPPEILHRVMEPFFTTKPVGRGTGLGLSICHGIITSLGGELKVANRPEGGTSARITLPVAATTARALDDSDAVAQVKG